MKKNIANPIALIMLLLAEIPGIGNATELKYKLTNIYQRVRRPEMRSMLSVTLIVMLSTSLFLSMAPMEAQAAGGAYTVKWYAADPAVNHAPYLPTYQKLTPNQLSCPGTAGRYADPLPNAVAYGPGSTSLDALTSLAPSAMALGQIVPFETVISVKGSTSPENGRIQFTADFATNTSGNDNFGYDPAYMVYCAFVDTADGGTIDPNNNAKVDSFTSTLVGSGSNQNIRGTFNVSGLDDGDQVVVEIWVVLKSTIPKGSTGNVATNVVSAQTASGDTINSGSQNVNINKIQEFFTSNADVSVIKEDSPDPVNLSEYLNYTIVVKNNSPDTVANGINVTDTLDPNTTFVSASPAPSTVTGNNITFGPFSLSPGQNATFLINTKVSSTAPTNNDTSTNSEAGSVTKPTLFDLLNRVIETAITADSNTTNNTYYQPTNVLGNPALSITKEASPTTYDTAGQTITYTYNVTNTGNVVVTGLNVTDNRSTTPVTLDKTIIQPGESVKGTASYTIVQSDIDAGSVTNLAYATGIFAGNQVKSNEATQTVTANQNAALSITKTATPTTYSAVGEVISYAYTVKNDGNVVVTGLTVTDDKATVTLDKDTIAPGETVTGTASYTIAQADIDAGSVTNVAFAAGKYNGGKDVKSNEATQTVTANQNAVLNITKTATPTTYSAVGEVISYAYTVKNDGNVVVTGLTVTDDKATVTLDKDTIAPGETATGTASYTIVQSDIDAGSVTNVAFAAGKYNGGKDVKSNEATATVNKLELTGQICPTQTTCDQYMSGTAADLDNATYLADDKTASIKSVAPGVMFYYSTITVSTGGPKTTTTISVSQSNNGSWPYIAIQDAKQVILYNSDCTKVSGTQAKQATDGMVTLTAKSLNNGTYYLGIKYSLSSLQNFKKVISPYPTVKYTFVTSLNGNEISTSKDSIDLIPKNNLQASNLQASTEQVNNSTLNNSTLNNNTLNNNTLNNNTLNNNTLNNNTLNNNTLNNNTLNNDTIPDNSTLNNTSLNNTSSM